MAQLLSPRHLDNLKPFKGAGRKIIVERFAVIKFRRYESISKNYNRISF